MRNGTSVGCSFEGIELKPLAAKICFQQAGEPQLKKFLLSLPCAPSLRCPQDWIPSLSHLIQQMRETNCCPLMPGLCPRIPTWPRPAG